MSTPANIAIVNSDGRMHIFNVANDGYPNGAGVGNTLLNVYNTPAKVHQLSKLNNLNTLGFSTKQANALKEGGVSWSQHDGAKLFSKRSDRWFGAVGNYTQSFKRDWGRDSENGQNVKVDNAPITTDKWLTKNPKHAMALSAFTGTRMKSALKQRIHTLRTRMPKLKEMGLEHLAKANLKKSVRSSWEFKPNKVYSGKMLDADNTNIHPMTEKDFVNRVKNLPEGMKREEALASLGNKKTPRELMSKLNDSSQWESEYNYLYDDNTKKWYVGTGMDNDARPLSKVVSLRDRKTMHSNYKKFQSTKFNPHLPQWDTKKIHQHIDKKLNHGTFSYKKDVAFDKGTIQSAVDGNKAMRERLKSENLDFGRSLLLTNGIKENAKGMAEYTKQLHHDQARVTNLQKIDRYVQRHPAFRLYPNDLNTNRHLGKKLEKREQVSPETKNEHFLNSHPKVAHKLGVMTSQQSQNKLKDVQFKNQFSISQEADVYQITHDLQNVPDKVASARQAHAIATEKLDHLKPHKLYKEEGINGYQSMLHTVSNDDFRKKYHQLRQAKHLSPQMKQMQKLFGSKSDFQKNVLDKISHANHLENASANKNQEKRNQKKHSVKNEIVQSQNKDKGRSKGQGHKHSHGQGDDFER